MAAPRRDCAGDQPGTVGTAQHDRRDDSPTQRPTANPPRPYRFSIQLPALIAETQHLDPEAFGCYMRLLHAYWQSGPARDNDRVLARLVGLAPDEWAAIRPDVEPYFDMLHGQWIHWRLDQELERAYDAINANRKRTDAARAAKRAKTASRDDGCDSACDSSCDNGEVSHSRDSACDKPFDNVPIGSKHAPHAVPPKTPRSQAKVAMDFDEDVRIAERDLGIGGGK